MAGARVRLGQAALQSDAAGEFAVDRVSPTESVQIEADGYQSIQSRLWLRRDLLVELAPRGFALHVRDAETNEPVPDAIAVAQGVRFDLVEAGRFRVEPARDAISITVSAPGSAAPWSATKARASWSLNCSRAYSAP